MNDSQYLHLLLADEKLARMQLQTHVSDLEPTVKELKDRIAEIEETSGTQCGLYISFIVTNFTVGCAIVSFVRRRDNVRI